MNAGSDSVSTFELRPHELRLKSVVPSGGQHPISVTESDGTVFVLNDLGLSNVVGFSNARGQLKPLAGAMGNLSVAGGAGPAQVGLNEHGDTLVVTEKNTNKLSSFAVGEDGRLGAPVVTDSPGLTPFGFAFTRRNTLVVSEAVGGAAGASTVSSYQVSRKAAGAPAVVSPAVADTQSAACWVAVTPNGRWAFISNTGSGTVSSYSIARGGAIRLVQAAAGQTGVGSAPADSAISPEGRPPVRAQRAHGDDCCLRHRRRWLTDGHALRHRTAGHRRRSGRELRRSLPAWTLRGRSSRGAGAAQSHRGNPADACRLELAVRRLGPALIAVRPIHGRLTLRVRP